MTIPEQKPVPERNLEDSGKRCRKCQYNLTGLTESRCPECGEDSLEEEALDCVRLISLKRRIVWVDKAAILVMVLMVVVPPGKGSGLFFMIPNPWVLVWGLLLLMQWVLAFVGGWQTLTLLARDELDGTWIGLALLPFGLAALMCFGAGRLLELKGF